LLFGEPPETKPPEELNEEAPLHLTKNLDEYRDQTGLGLYTLDIFG